MTDTIIHNTNLLSNDDGLSLLSFNVADMSSNGCFVVSCTNALRLGSSFLFISAQIASTRALRLASASESLVSILWQVYVQSYSIHPINDVLIYLVFLRLVASSKEFSSSTSLAFLLGITVAISTGVFGDWLL